MVIVMVSQYGAGTQSALGIFAEAKGIGGPKLCAPGTAPNTERLGGLRVLQSRSKGRMKLCVIPQGLMRRQIMPIL